MVVAVAPRPSQRVAFLPTGHLRIDPSYQRDVNEPRIKRMAAAWDDRRADTLTVSARDGSFYVLDGQHRLLAARMAGIASMVSTRHVPGRSRVREGLEWLSFLALLIGAVLILSLQDVRL